MRTYDVQTITSPDYYVSTPSVPEWSSIWILVALVLAIVGGILVYFLFVRPKTQPKGKFAQWLKKFLAFKIMWIEAIIKITYYIATIFCIVGSIAFIGVDFAAFLSMLILAPVLLRLLYEGMLILIMIWQNTQNIADNTTPTTKKK